MSVLNCSKVRILNHFSHCEDPRTRPCRYPLQEIILIVHLATLCGEEGWEGMVEWANDKIELLREFLPYDNGIPCPDTIRRVIERINPKEFLSSFISWVTEFKTRSPGQVCIDGKTLKHAMAEGGALHLVTAWCEQNQMVLGSVKTASKSNEITAIRELLSHLVLLEDDVVTIDAIGCQRDIAVTVRDTGAQYVLAVKRNQQSLADEMSNFFEQATDAAEYVALTRGEQVRADHGRNDTQEIWISEDIDWLPGLDRWKDLRTLIMVHRTWKEKGESRQEKRFYISSLSATPERFLEIVRRHWSIENELHWQLDVTFSEDDSNIGAAANENLRVARMTSLEMLRTDKSSSKGLKAKAKRCHRSDSYLKQILISGNF